MGNALLDFGNENGFSVYGGGGLGYARVRVNDVESAFDQVDGKESGLAWQLIAGARYAVSDNIDLGLKYRYFQGPEMEFGQQFTGDSFVEYDAGRFKSQA